ncbi:hypothetical protein ACTXT7_010682 [Hymenolepis weldensis]
MVRIRKQRQLCELYGYWCNGDSTENESDSVHRYKRSDSEDREIGTCIRPSMRCDGLPDCWLEDPENSPDEVGCNVGHSTEAEEPLSPYDYFNETYPTASCK